VTGAASGVGEGIARRFVAEVAKVVPADCDGDKAQAMAGSLGPSSMAMAMRSIGASYLVGTPKGRLTRLEQAFLNKP
jgi:NAD(P)-dependent dehydrogenase (short-subunit alcohol dehydrogenase family)